MGVVFGPKTRNRSVAAYVVLLSVLVDSDPSPSWCLLQQHSPLLAQNFGAENPQRSFKALFLSMRFAVLFQGLIFLMKVVPLSIPFSCPFLSGRVCSRYLVALPRIVPFSYGFQGIVMMLIEDYNECHASTTQSLPMELHAPFLPCHLHLGRQPTWWCRRVVYWRLGNMSWAAFQGTCLPRFARVKGAGQVAGAGADEFEWRDAKRKKQIREDFGTNVRLKWHSGSARHSWRGTSAVGIAILHGLMPRCLRFQTLRPSVLEWRL